MRALAAPAALLLAGLGGAWGLGRLAPAMSSQAASLTGWPCPGTGPAPALEIAIPLLVALTALWWWLPGGLFALALLRPTRSSLWLVQGFAFSFLLHPAAFHAAKRLGGLPLEAPGALTASLGLGLLGLLALALRPVETWPSRALPTALLLLIPAGLAAAMGPQLWGSNLNDDGQEALFLGESLLRGFVPSWPTPAGQVGLGAGMFASAWMAEGPVALLGSLPFAPRLPLLILAPLLVGAVQELAAAGHPTPPRCRPLLITASIAVLLPLFVLMSSAGYDPYFCDPASPAAFDALLLVALLGALAAMLDGRFGLFCALFFVAVLARPTPAMIAGLAFAAGIFVRGEGRRRFLLFGALGAVMAVGLALLHERLYLPAVSEGAGESYRAAGVLSRFRYLRYTDVERVAWMIVPCGVVPVVSLLRYRTLDPNTRRLWLVTLAYVGVFYFPAFTSLHHFAPAMVLPIVLLLRSAAPLEPKARGAVAFAWLLGLAAATALSWPTRLEVDHRYARLGAQLDAPEEATASRVRPREPARVLEALSAPEVLGHDAREELVGAAWPMLRTAGRNELPRWRLQRPRETIPPGWRRVAERDGWLLLEAPGVSLTPLPGPDGPYTAPLYRIPRELLHRHLGEPKKVWQLDPKEILRGG